MSRQEDLQYVSQKTLLVSVYLSVCLAHIEHTCWRPSICLYVCLSVCQPSELSCPAEEAAAVQAARRADKLSSKMKRSLQARADKLGSLGCTVAVTHLSRKGRISHITSAPLLEALQACTPEQQLALEQELQKGPEKLIQLLRVGRVGLAVNHVIATRCPCSMSVLCVVRCALACCVGLLYQYAAAAKSHASAV